MEFGCKDRADGRSARPENADGAELVISISMGTTTKVPTAGAESEPVEIIEKVVLTSSKTRVRYQFADAQRGKQISLKGRWYNNTDHSKDGPGGNAVSGYVG